MNDLEFVGDYRQPQLSARQRALGHDGTSAGEFTFGDFVDIINPLQHIPVISTLYREITGDEISPHARILGDTLFGGPSGFISAIANVLYEEVAGEDIGETVIAFFTGEEAETDPQFANIGGEVVPAAGESASPPAAPLETAAGPQPSGPTSTAVAAPDAYVEAVLPEPAPGMLTGQDALNALFFDLGGGRSPAPAPAAPAAAPAPSKSRPVAVAETARFYPLPTRHIRVAPATPPSPTPPAGVQPLPGSAAAAPASVGAESHPLLFAQEAGDNAIADRMMQALDKYRAQSQQSRREENREEEDKRVPWQSDPAAGSGS